MSTYQPQVGDRVRVVLEGEVLDVFGDQAPRRPYIDVSSSTDNEGASHTINLNCVVSVEKVAPPLPTTPGSAVRHRASGTVYTICREGGLFSHSANGVLPAVSVSEFNAKGFDVLFDAGEVTR